MGKSLYYMDCHVAGFKYWDGIDVFNQLRIGDEVQLSVKRTMRMMQKQLRYIGRKVNWDTFPVTRIQIYPNSWIWGMKISSRY